MIKRAGHERKNGILAILLVVVTACVGLWAVKHDADEGADVGEGEADSAEGPAAAAHSWSEEEADEPSVRAAVLGRITDPRGEAIAGVTVCAWPDPVALRGAAPELPTCGESDREGRYRLESLAPVATSIRASARA